MKIENRRSTRRIVAAIAHGTGAEYTEYIRSPYFAPSPPAPYGRAEPFKNPGVWIASHRREILINEFRISTRRVIAWRVVGSRLYWTVIPG